MFNLFDETSVDRLIRGEVIPRAAMSYPQHPRSLRSNFLGLWISQLTQGPFCELTITAGYSKAIKILGMIQNPIILSAIERNFPKPAEEKDLLVTLQALCCLRDQFDCGEFDWPDQDRADSDWGQYLLSIKDRGFRARQFHTEGAYTGFSTSVFLMTAKFSFHGLGTRSHSFFPAVDVDGSLGDEYFCTYATHLAAKSNCPEVMKALGASREDFMRQDKLRYADTLGGLTSLHHAAHGLAGDALRYLLFEIGIGYELKDAEDNTILHALACSIATADKADPAKLEAGEKRQLAVFNIIYEALVKPFIVTHPLLRDLAGAGGPTVTSPAKPSDDYLKLFFQAKNKKGQTALQVAAASGNRALVAKLMTVPGADLREIDPEKAGIHAGNVYQESLAQLNLQIAALNLRVADLEKDIFEKTSRLVAAFQGLSTALALTRDELHETQTELAEMYQFMSAMSETLEARGVLRRGFQLEFFAHRRRAAAASEKTEKPLLAWQP